MFLSLINVLFLLHVVCCLPVQKGVTEVDVNTRENILHEAESFYGDIVLTKEQKKAFELVRERRQLINGSSTALLNSVMSTTERLWPNRTVYYNITAPARGKKTYRAIMQAINQFRQKSCLKFVERTTQPDYVFFTKGTGCHSNVGRIGGAQAISIGAGCERPGIVMHEIFHALGRWHEQNRPDRNEFVSIRLENVEKKYHNNFAKLSFVKTFNIPYDLQSLMHYPANAFSKNGHPSIVPVVQTNVQLGQREKFTSSDLEYLNTLYQCDSEVWSAWSSWSSCSASCGEGQRTRYRTCQGNGCQATEQKEALSCNTQKCQDTSWTQWSSCSQTCEGGVQTRWQMCHESINCPGELMTRSCNSNIPCSTKPVPPTHNPDEGLWGEWSECTKPCGGGNKTRRECGVDDCRTETVPCNTQICRPEQVQQHIGCFIVPNDRNSPLQSLEKLAPDVLFGNPAQRSEPVKKCRKVAEQYKFDVFGVALGYCISGSNHLADYTTVVAPLNSCSSGKGGYQSSPNNEFYMDVYKLLDDNVQNLNSTDIILPAKLTTSTIIPELTNSSGVLAANSFILLITLISLLI